MNDEVTENGRFKMSKGGKNLTILGIVSVIVATVTCGISLAIYHNSGDIYLDRSRPGFLPEEGDSINDPVVEEYSFSKSGKLNITDIEEYLKNLNIDINAIDSYEKPFNQDVLSDKNLGITK